MKVPTKLHGNVATTYTALQREWETFIQRGMKKHNVTGLSVALVDDGNIVWAQGFGYADKERKQVADAYTLYKVGSITKVFTGAAVMQLVEKALLDLDEPIQRYIPELNIKYHYSLTIPVAFKI